MRLSPQCGGPPFATGELSVMLMEYPRLGCAELRCTLRQVQRFSTWSFKCCHRSATWHGVLYVQARPCSQFAAAGRATRVHRCVRVSGIVHFVQQALITC